MVAKTISGRRGIIAIYPENPTATDAAEDIMTKITI
jgi:aspartate/methionine/tyrosine aminotransferase